MTVMETLYLYGCRHDILGHYLKAIGLLRVLARCADEAHRDADAEGWWDNDEGCFCLRSPRYPTRERLVEFFAAHYRPTPLFAAWNKETGCSDSDSEKFGALADWKVANHLSSQVVSAEDRKKPANCDKLIAIEALAAYRDSAAAIVSEAVDSIAAPFLKSNAEHPLFLSKGIAGRAHLWRSHWEYLAAFQKHRDALAKAAKKVTIHDGTAKQLAKLKQKVDDLLQPLRNLLPFEENCASAAKGKGTPFFPDAIKSYNIGSGWVTENYPFNALDYVLAVEGGFAMRGGVGRTLAANSRRFAAFPFVFDAGEDLVDDANEVKGTSSALWFPLWDRPVTFAELSSFISDAQARLPGKDARFSAEFMRALQSQGVDAGFAGWQEFRFKMKISRVPWITTGAHIESSFREDATRLNRALQPLDESQFLDQFDVRWKGGKADARSPHPIRCSITSAMESSMREPTPHNCLDLLCTMFRACRKMAVSESFRDTLSGKRARFFRPLPMGDWNGLIEDLATLDPTHPQVGAEFRIARAVASIPGLLRQRDQHAHSEAQPMLGSLLPLTLEKWGWHLPLPPKETPSKQAVWTGTDICHDLAAILSRRYLDSLEDDQPALRGVHQARLDDILAFLNGSLDDHLIARWIEALSLIGWHFCKQAGGIGEDRRKEQVLADLSADLAPTDSGCDESTSPNYAIPFAYATLRTLLDLECEWQGRNRESWKKRRSQQPFALLCQRSASGISIAVSEALRWISIWGVRNPWGAQARRDKERLTGRDIVRLSHTEISSAAGLAEPADHARRLAAAVCIPLAWEDQWRLRRAVTLPQAI